MDLLDWIGDHFDQLGEYIVRVLPGSPIVYLERSAAFTKAVSYLNWFIPVYEMIALTETWLVCIVVYYVVQVILRWVKVVE